MKTAKNNRFIVAAVSCTLLTGCFEKTEEKPVEHTIGEPVPKVLPNSVTVKRGKKVYLVNGLGVGDTNRMAIVNNEVYHAGAEIEPGIVLKDVQLTYARLVVNDKEHLLRPESIQKQMDMQRTVDGK